MKNKQAKASGVPCMSENLRRFNDSVEKVVEDVAYAKGCNNAKAQELSKTIDLLNQDIKNIQEAMKKVTLTLNHQHEMDQTIIQEVGKRKKEVDDRLEMLDSRAESFDVFAQLTTKRMQDQHNSLVQSFQVVDRWFMAMHNDIVNLNSTVQGIVMALSNGTGGFQTSEGYQAKPKSVTSVYKSFKFDKA